MINWIKVPDNSTPVVVSSESQPEFNRVRWVAIDTERGPDKTVGLILATDDPKYIYCSLVSCHNLPEKHSFYSSEETFVSCEQMTEAGAKLFVEKFYYVG